MSNHLCLGQLCLQRSNRKAIELKKIVKYVGVLLSVLSMCFVVKSIICMNMDYSTIFNNRKLLVVFIVGIFISVLLTYILAYAWVRFINYFSSIKVNFNMGINIYVKANLGKYLPGNVAHYIERNVFMNKYGVSHKNIIIGTVSEMGGLAIAAIITSCILSYKQILMIFEKLILDRINLLVVIVLCMIILSAFIIVFIKYFKGINILSYLVTLITNMLLYSIVFLLYGLLFLFLFWTFDKDIFNNVEICLQLISVYMIAWVAGFCVPGAPGGIGVREYVIGLLLGGSKLFEIAMVVAVIHRLITVLGDVVSYFIAMVYLKLVYQHIHI